MPYNDALYEQKLMTAKEAAEIVKIQPERAQDIISLAHPIFRDELLRETENMYLI